MRYKDPKLMQDIVDFVNKYYEENYRCPSSRTIAAAVGSNKFSVTNYLRELAEKGELTYDGRTVRTPKMELLDKDVENVGLIGSVSCGVPTLEEENVEAYLPLPSRIFGSGELYLLTANGNSMIGAGIAHGDLIVVRKTSEAKEGDIVVALIDDETTLKRIFFDGKKHMVRLHPENEAYPDILVESCVIQGVATHVIKALESMDIQRL